MARGSRKPDIPGSKFGSLTGIPVGTRWADRKAMSEDHVHPPLVAGIYGRKADGARSVVLAGEYDDEDHGETFTYIGSGGREPGLRFGPQTLDQSFDNNLNEALRMSACRQTPVRVIRGPGLRSRYTPYAGFRYDGLYTVHNPRLEKAANGLMLVKVDFRRIPGQPPLPELERRPPDDIQIRHAQYKTMRRKREQNRGSSAPPKPITAKWEGAGAAPSSRPNAVASGSDSTSRPRASSSGMRMRSPIGDEDARSSTPLTITSGEEWGDIDARDLGLEDSDEEDMSARAEEEEDQEDLFADIDNVTSEFRPVQSKLDELNQPGDSAGIKQARRSLLVEIGDFVRKALVRKQHGDHGHNLTWWKHEMWSYVSTYLPTNKIMQPEDLKAIYKKYKKQKLREQAKGGLKQRAR